MTKCWLFILAPFARAADQRGTFTQNRKSPSMINTRPSRNAKNASDLVAALLSNVDALRNLAALLSSDVCRLYEKIDFRQRAADSLHRKIQTAQARIRIIRSEELIRHRTRTDRSASKLYVACQIGLTPLTKL